LEVGAAPLRNTHGLSHAIGRQANQPRRGQEAVVGIDENKAVVRSAFAPLETILESHEQLYGREWVGRFPGMPPLDAEGHKEYSLVMQSAFPGSRANDRADHRRRRQGGRSLERQGYASGRFQRPSADRQHRHELGDHDLPDREREDRGGMERVRHARPPPAGRRASVPRGLTAPSTTDAGSPSASSRYSEGLAQSCSTASGSWCRPQNSMIRPSLFR
jgi:hypothetical protein